MRSDLSEIGEEVSEVVAHGAQRQSSACSTGIAQVLQAGRVPHGEAVGYRCDRR